VAHREDESRSAYGPSIHNSKIYFFFSVEFYWFYCKLFLMSLKCFCRSFVRLVLSEGPDGDDYIGWLCDQQIFKNSQGKGDSGNNSENNTLIMDILLLESADENDKTRILWRNRKLLFRLCFDYQHYCHYKIQQLKGVPGPSENIKCCSDVSKDYSKRFNWIRKHMKTCFRSKVRVLKLSNSFDSADTDGDFNDGDFKKNPGISKTPENSLCSPEGFKIQDEEETESENPMCFSEFEAPFGNSANVRPGFSFPESFNNLVYKEPSLRKEDSDDAIFIDDNEEPTQPNSEKLSEFSTQNTPFKTPKKMGGIVRGGVMLSPGNFLNKIMRMEPKVPSYPSFSPPSSASVTRSSVLTTSPKSKNDNTTDNSLFTTPPTTSSCQTSTSDIFMCMAPKKPYFSTTVIAGSISSSNSIPSSDPSRSSISIPKPKRNLSVDFIGLKPSGKHKKFSGVLEITEFFLELSQPEDYLDSPSGSSVSPILFT